MSRPIDKKKSIHSDFSYSRLFLTNNQSMRRQTLINNNLLLLSRNKLWQYNTNNLIKNTITTVDIVLKQH